MVLIRGTFVSLIYEHAIHLMSITWGVLAQSPEPEARLMQLQGLTIIQIEMEFGNVDGYACAVFVFMSKVNESLHSNTPTTGHFMTGREDARFVV